MSAPAYVIELKGTLGNRFERCFGELDMSRNEGRTVLSGQLDQSQLLGVLNHANELGIELVRVERQRPASASTMSEGDPR